MISILSYNIRGISSIKKQSLLRKWIETNPHDVLLLQELHMTTQSQLESFKRSFPDYIIICSLGTWSTGGVMVMSKHKVGMIDYGQGRRDRGGGGVGGHPPPASENFDWSFLRI